MPPLLFVVFFTLSSSVFSCNELERLMLKRVARKEFGFYFIYAIDKTLTSRNALDTLYDSLNFRNRDSMIPFVFKIDVFKKALMTSVKAPGLCQADASYKIILSRVKTNRTMFGVFYACNLFDFREYILFVVNMNNNSSKNIAKIQINRRLQPQFCKCEQGQKAFTEKCLNEQNGADNWRLLTVLLAAAAAFLTLLGFKIYTLVRARTNVVSPFIT